MLCINMVGRFRRIMAQEGNYCARAAQYIYLGPKWILEILQSATQTVKDLYSKNSLGGLFLVPFNLSLATSNLDRCRQRRVIIVKYQMKRRKQEMQMIVWNGSRCMLLHAFRRMIFLQNTKFNGCKTTIFVYHV